MGMDRKACTKCEQEKTLEDFSKDAQKRDGLASHCRVCQHAKSQLYKRSNPEKLRAKRAARYFREREKAAEDHKVYYEQNKERIRKQAHDYHAANKGRVRERKRQYDDQNADHIRQRKQRWRSANPERIADYRHRRRSQVPSTVLVGRQAIYDRDQGVCGICRASIDGAYEVDHIVPVSLGGIHHPSNVQVAHPLCNRQKQAHLDGQIHLPV